MEDTHTFQDCNKLFTFTVHKRFLKKCFEPSEYDCYVLMTKYDLKDYLHNPIGPAIICHDDNNSLQFWLNGKIVSSDDFIRLKHNYEFKGKFSNLINE